MQPSSPDAAGIFISEYERRETIRACIVWCSYMALMQSAAFVLLFIAQRVV
jgi:hypothetical protein